jgi:hypothetical protein
MSSTLFELPFCSFLEIGSCFCPGQPRPWPSYSALPIDAGISGTYHYAQIFSLRWDFINFFAWAGLVPLSSQSQPS